MFKVKIFNEGFPQIGESIDNEKSINDALADWKTENDVNIIAIAPFHYRDSNVIALCIMYTDKK